MGNDLYYYKSENIYLLLNKALEYDNCIKIYQLFRGYKSSKV